MAVTNPAKISRSRNKAAKSVWMFHRTEKCCVLYGEFFPRLISTNQAGRTLFRATRRSGWNNQLEQVFVTFSRHDEDNWICRSGECCRRQLHRLQTVSSLVNPNWSSFVNTVHLFTSKQSDFCKCSSQVHICTEVILWTWLTSTVSETSSRSSVLLPSASTRFNLFESESFG